MDLDTSDLASMVQRLEAIVADLDDLALSALHQAAEAGGPRPELDKRLVQARRAVEKAAHVLRASPT